MMYTFMILNKMLTENRSITLTNSGPPSPLKFAKKKIEKKYTLISISIHCILWVDDTVMLFALRGGLLFIMRD